jgi:hypothetical protein
MKTPTQTANDIFETQAHFNKWLKELTETERTHVIAMIVEGIETHLPMTFPKRNILDAWLEKHGDPEIEKQVEQEADERNNRKMIYVVHEWHVKQFPELLKRDDVVVVKKLNPNTSW